MTLQQEIKRLIELRDSLTACINRLGATESSASLANHKIVHEIQCKCCEYFNVKFEVLMSGSREQRIANCRAIAIYLCKKQLKTSITNKELGELFGCSASNISAAIMRVGSCPSTDLPFGYSHWPLELKQYYDTTTTNPCS